MRSLPSTPQPLLFAKKDCCSDQIRENVLVRQYYCDVDIAHLISYNEELAHRLTSQPADTIPLVSRGFLESLSSALTGQSSKRLSNNVPIE